MTHQRHPHHLTTLEAALDLKAALTALGAELANVAHLHTLADHLRARAAVLLNDAAHERGRALRALHNDGLPPDETNDAGP